METNAIDRFNQIVANIENKKGGYYTKKVGRTKIEIFYNEIYVSLCVTWSESKHREIESCVYLHNPNARTFFDEKHVAIGSNDGWVKLPIDTFDKLV